jgi:hypothetical protein
MSIGEVVLPVSTGRIAFTVIVLALVLAILIKAARP